MRSHNKKFLTKASRMFGGDNNGDNKVLNFRSSPFMLCQNLIKTLYVLVVVYIS